MTAIPREQEVKPVAVGVLEYIDMAENRLECENCTECVKLAISYLQEARQLLTAPPSDSPGSAHQPQLSEQQRHCVEHARYQVKHATPDDPECCFDYQLVETLLDIIDAHQPQGGDARGTKPKGTR